jgi:hypothetical protein
MHTSIYIKYIYIKYISPTAFRYQLELTKIHTNNSNEMLLGVKLLTLHNSNGSNIRLYYCKEVRRIQMAQYSYLLCPTTHTVVRYGLEGPGIESRWGQTFFTPVKTGHGTHPTSYKMGTALFPGVKWPGRDFGHSPHLARKLKKE